MTDIASMLRSRVFNALTKARDECAATAQAWDDALAAVSQTRQDAMTARAIRDRLEAAWDDSYGDSDDAA